MSLSSDNRRLLVASENRDRDTNVGSAGFLFVQSDLSAFDVMKLNMDATLTRH